MHKKYANRLGFLLILSCLTVSSGSGFSQIRNGKFGIGVLAGGSKLKGDIEVTNTAFTTGLLFRYTPKPLFALTLSGTYGNLNSGLNAIKTNILSIGLSATAFVFPRSKLRPFVSIGLSNFRYTVKDAQDQQISPANSGLLDGWRQAAQLGVGLELFVSRSLALTTVGDYLVSTVDDLDGIVEGQKDGYLRGLFGLVFYLGNTSPQPQARSRWEHRLGASFEQVRQEEPQANDVDEQALDKDRLFTEGISFEPGGTHIQERSRWQLVKVFRFLQSNPAEVLELRPLSGTDIKDQKIRELVLARARSVKKYLVDLGVEQHRIVVRED